MKETKTIEMKIVVDKETISAAIEEAVKRQIDKLEEEQKPCDWCVTLRDKELVRFNYGFFHGATANYCPNCGRKL